MTKRKISNSGITLIALVLTIIVLLILAGVSIAMLSGDNSILKNTTRARTKTIDAQDEETIGLAYLAAITGKSSESIDTLTTILETELEKTYGSGKVTVTKDGNTYTINITEKGIYKIDTNGTVTKSGPVVSYTNERIVKSSAGTGEDVANNSQEEGTELYIYFEALVEGGTINSISPNVPFKITKNGTYNFNIIYTVDGQSYTATKSVKVTKYELRAGLKIGDYVIYTPAKASVTLSKDETGYGSEQTLSSKNKFRIMNINEDGSLELMGVVESSDDTVRFKGAQGYNNGVYTLNAKCSELYANEAKGITARSLNFEDITNKLNSAGMKKITNYIDSQIGTETTNGVLKTGSYITNIDKINKTVTYVMERSYYPNLFQYELGGRLGSIATSGVVTQSKSFNGYGNDGVLTDADKDEDENIIPQYSQADTLTVPYTYCNTFHLETDFAGTTNIASNYYNMFFGTKTEYWLASRCINCGSQNAYFDIRCINDKYMSGYKMLYSNNEDSAPYRVAPVVFIGPNIKIEKGTNDGTSSNPYTVILE